MPRLHIVTDDAVLARPDFTSIATALIRSLGTEAAVHIRGPHTPGGRVFELARAIADEVGTTSLLINDRVDVALSVGAGVHLGGRSLPVSAARALLPSDTLVGRSIRHEAAEGAGADYLFAGPVFETDSHPDSPGRGPDWLRQIVAGDVTKVVAIGGISLERTGVLLGADAFGVAGIRFVWDAPDPIRAAHDLSNQLYRRS